MNNKLNELQLIEKDLLCEYIKFCEQHNLTYFLIGGTLLGAIRHNGFIPWDDDIDVAMPREDYDKFCFLAEKYFIADTFFQSYRTDKNYPYIFTKLRNSNTTFVEKIYSRVSMNHGVYIDIFPIDGISTKTKTTPKKLHKKIIWKSLLFLVSWPKNLFRKPHLKTCISDILIDILVLPFYLFHINNWSKKLYEKQMKKIRIEDATFVANIQCGDYRNKGNVYPKYLLDEYIDWPFEDLICKVPKHYDEFLTLSYGDYMKLPPIEKQVGHHYNSGYDMHKSYREYQKN